MGVINLWWEESTGGWIFPGVGESEVGTMVGSQKLPERFAELPIGKYQKHPAKENLVFKTQLISFPMF